MKIKLPKERDRSEWHKWFAWYPVYVRKYDERFIVWLQTIETSTLYGAMSSKDQYRFRDELASKCYCTCGPELLQDENSIVFYTGKLTNIICNICNMQTTWDLDTPVPLFIDNKCDCKDTFESVCYHEKTNNPI